MLSSLSNVSAKHSYSNNIVKKSVITLDWDVLLITVQRYIQVTRKSLNRTSILVHCLLTDELLFAPLYIVALHLYR